MGLENSNRKTLRELQDFQEEHDKNFHKDIFSMGSGDRLRHMIHHLAKISGRFSDYFDKKDHGEEELAELILNELKEKRTPDLFAFSLIISSIFDIDLEESYFKRIKEFEK